MKKRKQDRTDRTRARVKKSRFLAALAKVPSVLHAAMAAGVHRSTVYEWRDNDPQFAEAWEQALEMSVDNLVVAAFQRALKGSDTLLTFLLRAHRGAIYNISSRVEQIGEPADEKKVSLNLYYNNGDQPLSELLNFPVHKSMAVGYDAWKAERDKQRRLAEESGATEKAPEEISDAPASNGTISDAPAPPKVVNPALTGRISDHWRGERRLGR